MRSRDALAQRKKKVKRFKDITFAFSPNTLDPSLTAYHNHTNLRLPLDGLHLTTLPTTRKPLRHTPSRPPHLPHRRSQPKHPNTTLHWHPPARIRWMTLYWCISAYASPVFGSLNFAGQDVRAQRCLGGVCGVSGYSFARLRGRVDEVGFLWAGLRVGGSEGQEDFGEGGGVEDAVCCVGGGSRVVWIWACVLCWLWLVFRGRGRRRGRWGCVGLVRGWEGLVQEAEGGGGWMANWWEPGGQPAVRLCGGGIGGGYMCCWWRMAQCVGWLHCVVQHRWWLVR